MTSLLATALVGWLGAASAGGANWSCEPVPLPGRAGPEDLALDPSTHPASRLFISALDRRRGHEDEDGALYALDLGDSDARPVQLKLAMEDFECSFRPHGIATIEGDDGISRLYVINHHARRDLSKGSGCCPWNETGFGRLRQHSIEVYRIYEDRLELEARLVDPLLAHPNDLAVLPDGEVFVSNSPPTLLSGLLDLWFGIGSNIVHYRDGSWHVAASRLRFANGVAALDSQVFVAETTGKRLRRYEIRKSPGSEEPCLQESGTLEVPGSPDNLSWTPDGALVVAIHDDLRAFSRHARDSMADRKEVASSPSKVLRIDSELGESSLLWRTASDEELSAASSAISTPAEGFIGQVFQPFILRCRKPPPQGAAGTGQGTGGREASR